MLVVSICETIYLASFQVSMPFQIIEFCYRFHGSQLNNNNNWSLSSNNLFRIWNWLRCAKIIFVVVSYEFCSRLGLTTDEDNFGHVYNIQCSTFIQIRWSKTRNFWHHNTTASTKKNLYSALNIEHWTFSELTNPIFEQFPTEHSLIFSYAMNHP